MGITAYLSWGTRRIAVPSFLQSVMAMLIPTGCTKKMSFKVPRQMLRGIHRGRRPQASNNIRLDVRKYFHATAVEKTRQFEGSDALDFLAAESNSANTLMHQ